MNNPIITIYDAETNSQLDREMTDKEYTEYLEQIKDTSATIEVTYDN